MSSLAINNMTVSDSLHAIPPKSFGEKVASVFIPHYELSNQIESIKGKVQKDPAYVINADELTQIKEAFVQSRSTFGGKLLKALTQLPPDEVSKALLAFMGEQEGKADVGPTIEKFLQLLDIEGLKNFTHLDDQKVDENILVQTLLKDEALKSILEVKGRAIWKEISVEIYYFIHHLIETCISWTGLTEIKGHSRRSPFNQGEISAYEAKSKIEAYLALLGYPSIIFASAFGILGSAVTAGIATGIIVAASLLMIPIYMRYLRPCPKEYDGFSNLNEKMMEKDCPPIYKRRDILTRIQNAFLAGKGVILTANPGVGKTTVVDSLAELVVSKQSEKFLAGTQLFSANASKMGEGGMGNLNFTGLENTFKRHNKDVVFFFDEIESIFKKSITNHKPVDPLLTFHDKFRYIICATTTEQYNNTIRDKEKAFNRRFVHIEINPLEKTELEVALYEYLHFKAPELALEENVIPYIIEKASAFNSQTSQVDAATSLLSTAIVKATVLSGGQLERDANALNLEADSLQKNMLHKGPSSAFTDEIQKYQQVMKDLKGKKIKLVKRQKELDKIKKLEQTCLTLKHSTYNIASEVKDHNPKKTLEWLKKQAHYKILTEFLAQKKAKIGLPTSINKELIDQIVLEAN